MALQISIWVKNEKLMLGLQKLIAEQFHFQGVVNFSDLVVIACWADPIQKRTSKVPVTWACGKAIVSPMHSACITQHKLQVPLKQRLSQALCYISSVLWQLSQPCWSYALTLRTGDLALISSLVPFWSPKLGHSWKPGQSLLLNGLLFINLWYGRCT